MVVEELAAEKEVPLTPADKKLVKKLSDFYATIGLFVSRADVYDGLVLIKESENRATEMVRVAKHHRGMYKILERISESNDYITCAVGHGIMAYAIMAHHGRVKADPIILKQYGYSEEEVLAPLMEAQQGQANGSAMYSPV